ncbi:sunset domain-containing protein [Companilactobacillus kedongensis]|uniref:sunset domain-containing protein n=1 Tax=Companilactobacillus kedongensis TaxID=2486004 RepID=UPI000F795192|nr:DNA-entry nuclease [Companilactobacillus kedongensis]
MNFIFKLAGIIFMISTIYYGVKLLRSRNKRRQGLKKRFFVSLFVFLLLGVLGNQTNEVKSSSNDNVKVIKKYIGKDKYKLAKEEHAALVAKKNKLTKQSDKTQDKKDDLVAKKDQEKEAAAKEQKKQAEAQKQAEKQAQEESKKQEQSQQAAPANANDGAKGDMNTSNTGQIVGNKNSHIYHVPGQRGYNMNSSNAVYFQSEQDAIAAGYRKAKV